LSKILDFSYIIWYFQVRRREKLDDRRHLVNTFKALTLLVFLAIFAFSPVLADESNTIAPTQATDKTPSSYDLVKKILGKDFLPPEEVTKARGFYYLKTQLAKFKKSLPSKEVLEWLKANDYMLVAGPPYTLSLLSMQRRDDTLFYHDSEEGWYANYKERFFYADTISPGWLALRKSSVPGSTEKTWGEQQASLSDNERVPNAAEVAWGLTTYQKVRDTYLMSGNVLVRTSSVSSRGVQVYVGGFASHKLDINDWKGEAPNSHLGVAAALKL